MAFIGRASATRGTLIKLEDNLKFIENGKNILKMKRDRLAGKLNTILNELMLREDMENQLTKLYIYYKESLAVLGYAEISTVASSGSLMKIDVKPNSIMGVTFPQILIQEKSGLDHVGDLSLRQVTSKMQDLVDEMFRVAQVEATIERIAYELVILNRKVNALEKIVIPDYEKLIRYIENLLFEEDLEDFARIKHSREVKSRSEA